MKSTLSAFVGLLVVMMLGSGSAFAPRASRPALLSANSFPSALSTIQRRDRMVTLTATEEEVGTDAPPSVDDDDSSAKASLEEKMKSWEATEEEVKSKSLGGVTVTPNAERPDANRADAFDISLWIMFPFMVGTGLLFFVFPFIMDKIDVSSVGPPPTM